MYGQNPPEMMTDRLTRTFKPLASISVHTIYMTSGVQPSAIACAVILILGLAWAYRYSIGNTTTAQVHGVTYSVRARRNSRDTKKAAKMLHLLSQRLQRFIDEARDMMPDDERIENIHKRWSGTLKETGGGDEEIAYSLNKRTIHICIRTATGIIEDPEVAMYVLLHEAAHVATNTYGHTPTFWTNFRFLLELAEQLGMYKYKDFTHQRTTYCGHQLGRNVMHCVKSQQCESTLSSLSKR